LFSLLDEVDLAKYRKYVVKDKKGNDTLYVELTKGFLYGTCQAALLFWKNLSSFLIDELGFTLNKYDKCVANKMIKGKQCTIIWHVNDLKMSHVNAEVLEKIIKRLDWTRNMVKTHGEPRNSPQIPWHDHRLQ
jgi:hypothetical protein